MTDKETSNLRTIDGTYPAQTAVCCFSSPRRKVPRLLTQEEGAVCTIYDLKDLNRQKGFVIAPFQVSETCPIVLIQPDRQEQLIDEDTKENPETTLQMQGQENKQSSPAEEYATRFHSFYKGLKQ